MRALKAQTGREPSVVPVELLSLPATMQAGRGSGKPHEGGSSLKGYILYLLRSLLTVSWD
ncbi:MAG: hypothetical protein RXO28_05850 [Thermocladium sp.]